MKLLLSSISFLFLAQSRTSVGIFDFYNILSVLLISIISKTSINIIPFSILLYTTQLHLFHFFSILNITLLNSFQRWSSLIYCFSLLLPILSASVNDSYYFRSIWWSAGSRNSQYPCLVQMAKIIPQDCSSRQVIESFMSTFV